MKKPLTLFAACLLGVALSGCGSTPSTGNADDRADLSVQCHDTLHQFTDRDPTLQRKLDSARAYAVFPEVLTAAVGVGGAHGRGIVYQNNRIIGYTDLSQGNIGIQLGAQTYAELVLFENDSSLSSFQQSTVEFDARATAVAAASGAAETADYSRGVLVFSLPQSGLMFQAAVGGQKFRYTSATNP